MPDSSGSSIPPNLGGLSPEALAARGLDAGQMATASDAQGGASQPDEAVVQLLARGLDAERMTSAADAHGWSPPSDEEAARLFPQFEEVALLGRGGMGAVYRGRQPALDRHVAIKLLPLEVSADAEFVDRFVREAQAMAKLSHPNIVAVHDFGKTSEGHLYFVMELVDGVNLHSLIHGPGMNPEQALNVAAQVCAALAYAHGKGVVHRDIKPANVLVDREGNAKVADFGVARLTTVADTDGQTTTGLAIGTPAYMAPEQMQGMHVDHRADIYSLGVMLYEMLCGEVPKGVFAPPSQRVPVDGRVDQIVNKAMQQAPERRYQSTTEMKTDVDAARTPPRMERSGLTREETTRKRSRIVIGGAASALIVAVAFALYVMLNERPPRTVPISTDAALPTATSAPASPRPTIRAPLHAVKGKPSTATQQEPYVNTLGMRFVPVPIPSGPSRGQRVLFSVWETRVQDYEAFANEEGVAVLKPPFSQDPAHPVVMVSWTNTRAFCEWLTKRERAAGHLRDGERYRLPTDHEWSCAVGIGDRENPTKTPKEKDQGIMGVYPWGDKWPPPPGVGNYSGQEAAAFKAVPLQGVCNDYRDSFPTTAPVGSFAANALGLFDLGGNVSEWCEDLFPPEPERRVVRMSSFLSGSPNFMMSSFRYGLGEAGGSPSVGFRTVLECERIEVPAETPPAEATQQQPYVNALGMKFVPVPVVGGPTDSHLVLFSIWETRVQDYEVFVRETRHEWPKAEFSQGPTHPAVMVNWNDATGFCAWLTERERRAGRLGAAEVYRLPKDHEWSCAVGIGALEDPNESVEEKDCKISDVFLSGTPWPPPPDSGNYSGEERVGNEVSKTQEIMLGYRDEYPTTSPVGSFGASASGLFDIDGNAYEWCEDLFDATKGTRVMRGGSFRNGRPDVFLSSQRAPSDPLGRNSLRGFRIVLDLGRNKSALALGGVRERTPSVSKVMPKPTPTAVVKPAPVAPAMTNTLGMEFVIVPITGGPSNGQRILFCTWETRVQDYALFAKETKREWPAPGFEQAATHPAVMVTWDDANAFCAWLTEQERKARRLTEAEEYRLPTDHEWSCAAEIGNHEDAGKSPADKNRKIANTFPWGNSWPIPEGAGNYAGEETRNALESKVEFRLGFLKSFSDGFLYTSPVGSFTATRLGLFDLGGNVWEWCEDWHGEKKGHRVLRGGSWQTGSFSSVTLSSRGTCTQNSRLSCNGFRCVVAPVRKVAEIKSATPMPNGETKSGEAASSSVNSLGMKFVPVPKTNVLFSIWETRVQDFEAFVNATGYDATRDVYSMRSGPTLRLTANGDTWKSPGFTQGPTHPVCGVSWIDARAFCDWLTAKERREGRLRPSDRYRLPTDAEWSIAGGVGGQEVGIWPKDKAGNLANTFPWGSQWPPSSNAGNFSGPELLDGSAPSKWPVLSGHRDAFPRTAEVGSFPPNELGIFDLAGNVWEWCEDLFDQNRPHRTKRGAAWAVGEIRYLQSSARANAEPHMRRVDTGFRCVIELSKE